MTIDDKFVDKLGNLVMKYGKKGLPLVRICSMMDGFLTQAKIMVSNSTHEVDAIKCTKCGEIHFTFNGIPASRWRDSPQEAFEEAQDNTLDAVFNQMGNKK